MLRDRNRAALVIWSVGNETAVTAERLAFQKQLVLDTREWDPTRLVSAALWARKEKRDGRPYSQIEDPLAELLDVLALNTYAGWYGDDTVADIASTVWQNRHGKPLLLSEFGADAKAGYREPQRRPKFSEEFQARLHRADPEDGIKHPLSARHLALAAERLSVTPARTPGVPSGLAPQTNQSYSPTQTGIYVVRITDSNGCDYSYSAVLHFNGI